MAESPRTHFEDRHIGPDRAEQARMLAALGYESLDTLTDAAVPPSIRRSAPLSLPEARSEVDVITALRERAERNQVMTSLIGMGYADTVTPAVIRRNVLENPAWYTAYTPYQPEISQGRLEALLDFQTMVADLTGMDLANASLLDEATAAAEAMAMCRRLAPKGGELFFVDADCHPQTLAVLRGRAEPLGIEVVVGDPERDLPGARCFGALLHYPGSSGAVRDHAAIVEAAHDAGTLVAVATDLLALTLLRPPGAIGADLVIGSAQRFGVPLGYGGPHAAFLACRDAHKRTLPGRLVGVSVDREGRPALRLALQTREQHIRREKATSNICTAQVLLAVIAGLYAVYHGPEGLRAIAVGVHERTTRLARALVAGGVTLLHDTWFDTLTVRVPGRADAVLTAARERGINLRRVDDDTVGVTLDETTTDATVALVLAAFDVDGVDGGGAGPAPIPMELERVDEFMTQEVFHAHRSETDMLRYLRRLADEDLALDRTMIPLGSCTMKLNATTEMEPISWPEFASIHPYAPAEQAAGYRQLVAELEAWLCEITGYDAVSLQPNAGSQGELAGLLAIRAFHRSRGEDRDVCLIPASAHGTNAASAVMAGMRVVVVATDGEGNIDLADLRAKADEHAGTLSALMVTYPSTHGVFETSIVEVCDLIHAHGGQVYVDGANLNALVGLAAPGSFGADVSHLNLHKTFCIPHGGGGPGVGPVAVRAHLAPYLPGDPLAVDATVPAVAAAPFGSAGILPIPWAYIAMMGADGLRHATQVAILAANYVARRLDEHYPVLYTGPAGLVAHECILDLRAITAATGVTAEDVAKRLIDYGFHAPTLSFPVAGTLMVEPTESESLAELDRFCAAMIAIRGEIERVERGEWTHDESPLAGAPHPAADVVADTWDRAYSRETAAYPVAGLHRAKYWPPVARIDGVYGDRNVVCSCAPVEAYADS
ncbi:MAG: aminomethyl-transferring glycine dehydrogenase [Acidimicrobiia bacterium]